MKIGCTLQDLANKVQYHRDKTRDFVAPAQKLRFALPYTSVGEGHPEKGPLELQVYQGDGRLEFAPTSLFHQQVGLRLAIPRAYYQRMQDEAPQLLMQNVNHWFGTSDDKRLVRTLDGRARAFLSDRYRPLDNYELCEAVLPVLNQQGADIVSCQLTETRLYLKAVLPGVEAEVKEGDVVRAGAFISNSEVGCGSLQVQGFIERLVCKNGMVRQDRSMKKYHTGRVFTGGGDDAWEVMRDETREISDRAFWMQVQDLTRAALNEADFKAYVSKLAEAAEQKMEKSPVEVVEVTRKQYGLTEGDGQGVLTHLIQGGDLSKWGLANALTRYSQDVKDYDKATEFERLGGRVVEMGARDWATLAN